MRKAFKEWALICWALGSGRQVLVLRKGGIREGAGAFALEARRFLLFPTYFHQGLEELQKERPDPDAILFRHWAEVAEAAPVDSLDALHALRGLHVWSDGVVEERFRRWGGGGLHALALRAHALSRPVRLPMRVAYRGCASWVDLEEDVPTAGSRPVLDEDAFARRLEAVRAAVGRPEGVRAPGFSV